jgi:hypothetical protein
MAATAEILRRGENPDKATTAAPNTATNKAT